MLSPQLRRKVHELWSLFWSSGLSNPLVAIEQITYLLFIRQLEALDRTRVEAGKTSIYALTDEERKKHKKEKAKPPDYEKCKWSYISDSPTIDVPLLRDTVFPWLRSLEGRVGPAQNGNTTLGHISGRLSDAYFVLDPNKTETLRKSISLIGELFRQLDTRSVNADIMGDIFEHLLEEVKESGKNGQFRTPRHVIRFMVQLLKPEMKNDVRILDPACGSAGFLMNTLTQWKADNTAEDVLRLEWDGTPHNTDKHTWPGGRKLEFNSVFRGYDNDRTMIRIAWMNLILHGLEIPDVHQLDSLSKRLKDEESGTYDYILANPPFTGNVDEGDLSQKNGRFPSAERGSGKITNKSELLFVWLMLDLLKIGGHAAVIVPDGVLFGTTKAHRALRRQLLFENTLEAVVSLPANMFQPYSSVKTSILLFQKAGDPVAAGAEPRTHEVWFYEVTDEAFSLDQKRKALYGQDNDFWDALVKFKVWNSYRQGETVDREGQTLTALRAAATAKDYHQPDYWEERWRSVDDEFLRIFPDKSSDKGHTYPLHELWPQDFRFDPADKRGSRQYDDVVLARVRPKFEKKLAKLVEQTVKHAYGTAKNPNAKKALDATEKKVKAVISLLNKKGRDDGLFDREFDQFGQNALKTILKEMTAKVKTWADAVPIPNKKPKTEPAEPDVDNAVESLTPLLSEFAKLDGYNIWRRSLESKVRIGKLIPSDESEPKREPTLLSWIVPVRQWAELENWGEDPEIKETIAKPTHRDGVIDPEYLFWLQNTLEVFDTDATVKKVFLNRLDPDCLEALDFNLSTGRHKPFVFDAGQHRRPAELIAELQAIHSEVQKRLGKLLTMVEGRE